MAVVTHLLARQFLAIAFSAQHHNRRQRQDSSIVESRPGSSCSSMQWGEWGNVEACMWVGDANAAYQMFGRSHVLHSAGIQQLAAKGFQQERRSKGNQIASQVSCVAVVDLLYFAATATSHLSMQLLCILSGSAASAPCAVPSQSCCAVRTSLLHCIKHAWQATLHWLLFARAQVALCMPLLNSLCAY